MEIIKIHPQGFCLGVINAIKKLNDELEKHTYENIYMLGGIVHNTHIINAYKSKNIKIIKTLEEINYDTVPTLIITAHGISDKKRKEILDKKINIIDTTCIEVRKIHDLILDYINNKYDVIYYGKKDHPECIGILEDNPSIHLISSINDIYNLNISNPNILFSSQTTASYDDIKVIEDLLKAKYSSLITTSNICTATKSRQLALIKDAKKCDMILVIGDRLSNNTNRLVNIASKYCKSILIENIKDIDNVNFGDINVLGITAGASTPNILVDEIIKYIKDANYISNLKDEDYIKF